MVAGMTYYGGEPSRGRSLGLITLFESNEVLFDSNGLGGLPDAQSCTVTEERNGEFELEMSYPVTGKRYSELRQRRILLAKPNPYGQEQPFRIYSITTPIDGVVTVYAAHISYDLSGYPVGPFSAAGAADAFEKMQKAAMVEQPFTFSTDVEGDTPVAQPKVASIRSVLAGSDDSILELCGGEYEFDRFSVMLHTARGEDRGVTVRYGKNLTDLEQEESCENTYSGVCPFWYSEQDGLATLDEGVLFEQEEPSFIRIYPLDMSSDFQERPTQEQLKEAAEKYIKESELGLAKYSLTVSFVDFPNLYPMLKKVMLCDTVHLAAENLHVSATAKCVKTVYNVLTQLYDEIELGEAKPDVAVSLSEQGKTLKNFTEAPLQANKIQGKLSASQLDDETMETIELSKRVVNGEETAKELKCERFWFSGHYVEWRDGILVQAEP